MSFQPVAIAQLAQTAAPLDASPTWTTLKALEHANTDRGRARSTDTFSAGRCDGTFGNRDRSYDPTYTAGPYGANLVPDKQCRVLVGLNMLTEQQSSLEDAVAGLGWTAAANCTVARSTSAHADGAASLALTSVAGGNMTATTPTGTSGIPVFAAATYTALASMRAAAAGRVVRVEIAFYDTSGTLLTTVLGDTVISPISDPVGSFTPTPPSVVATAPADGFAAMRVTVLATAGAAEVHYADMLAFFAGSDAALPWSRGTGLVPIFTGLVESWTVDRAGELTSTTALVAYDIFKLLSLKRLRKQTYFDAVQALTPDWFWRLNDKLAPSSSIVANAIHATSGPDGYQIGSPASADGPLVTDPDPALSIDYTKGFVQVPFVDSLGVNAEYSVAFWLKTSSQGVNVSSPVYPSSNPNGSGFGTAPIVWTGQIEPGTGYVVTGWALYLGAIPGGSTSAAPSVLYHVVHDAATASISEMNTSADVVVNDGNWHHIAVTRDSGWTMRIYVDGVEMASHTGGHDVVNSPTLGTSYFGHAVSTDVPTPAPSAIAMDLKDMAWWFSATLSGSDILDLYNAGVFPSETVGDRLARCLDVVGVDPARRSLDTGITLAAYTKPLHGSAALAHMAQVVEDDGGALFADASNVVIFHERGHAAPAVSATIADNPSGTDIPVSPGPGPVIDDLDLFDEVDITGDAIQPVIVNAGTDGTRNHQIADWQGLSQADANSLGSALYSQWSTPNARVRELSYQPQSQFSEAPATALKIDLLARVTHRQKGVGHVGTASTLTQYVERLTHDITPGKLWTVAHSLSPYP